MQKKYLKKLGMVDAFDNKADFSSAFDNPETSMSLTLQETRFELNEKGVKAAAVTVGKGEVMSVGPGMPFYCDEPFIYVVSERSSGAILFMGAIRKM